MEIKTKIISVIIAVIAIVAIGGYFTGFFSADEFVCNKPYIQVGTNCCFDKDDNSICDKDETPDYEAQTICSFSGLQEYFTCPSSKITSDNIELNLKSSKAGAIIVTKIEVPDLSCEAEFPSTELELLSGETEPNWIWLIEGETFTVEGKPTITLLNFDLDAAEITIDVGGIQETFSDTIIINGYKLTIVDMYVSVSDLEVVVIVYSEPDAVEMRFGETRQFNIPCELDTKYLDSEFIISFTYYAEEQNADSGQAWENTYELPKILTTKGRISGRVR